MILKLRFKPRSMRNKERFTEFTFLVAPGLIPYNIYIFFFHISSLTFCSFFSWYIYICIYSRVIVLAKLPFKKRSLYPRWKNEKKKMKNCIYNLYIYINLWLFHHRHLVRQRRTLSPVVPVTIPVYFYFIFFFRFPIVVCI